LSVDDVDFKNTCKPTLIDRENAYWQRIVDTLEEDVNHDRATCNRLRILRRQVLNGECRERRGKLPAEKDGHAVQASGEPVG